MEPVNRPVGVTVIAILLIFYGCAMLVVSLMILVRLGIGMLDLILAAVIVGAAVHFTSAIAMLQGCNWARVLYLWYKPISLLVRCMLYPGPSIIIGIIVYIWFLIILTRPSAISYFHQGRTVPAQNRPS